MSDAKEPALPQQWATTTIASVAEINPAGATVLVPDQQLVTFLGMAAVEELSGRINVTNRRPFGEVKKGFTRFRDGDVLFAKITPCMENGKVAVARDLAGGVGCGSTEFHVLRPKLGINPDYLRYYIVQSAFRQEARRNMQGAVGQQRVPVDFLRDAELPLAPASEQQRIVSKIDELFSRIDEGERALERVQKLVERYRQSVLKAAVTGELTRDWREKNQHQLESGEALLTRILKARREAWEKTELDKMKAKGITPANDKWKQKYEEPAVLDTSGLPALPEGWVWTTIDHIAECLDYAREPVSATVRASRPGSIPYYGANGQVGTIDEYLFDEPLVLVVEDETFTGRTKPFSYKIEGKTWVNNHAHVLRPTDVMTVDYLNAMLMRYPFIPLTTGTTARRKLTQKALMAAPVAVPPRLEQEEIISIVAATLSTTDSTEHDVGRSAQAAAALRQTILRAAFRGDLVSQEAHDEPASALLERIAAERSELPANPKRSRKPKTSEPA